MDKQNFLNGIRERLQGLPEEEIRKSEEYFSEMIDDRVEDGMTEEQAVEEIGSIDDAVSEILQDIPLMDVIKAKTKNRRKMKTWELVLLIVGSPIWVPVLIGLAAVALALYITIWALVISFFAVDFAFAISGIALFLGGIVGIFQISPSFGFTAIGSGLLLSGLTLLLFVPLIKLAKATAKLARVFVLWIKSLIIGGGKNA
ncbi:MAG: DUF1700 domain-containing protein [Parasporobacterium sp.]|nr:DUF1700 domain-containing protein [Parasporobacterium sp.]